ncbi:MAG TPA: type I-U CRISPR-associated protein Csb2 [Bryobacteraceae bacterium]|nr:type I-U CRISPR-associated protein Csb2 [Bryobacteraceae bacterium]HVW06944.1 type I-U CRISPR-associated protein Csb2 [Bryobacteraceae bacterium]
MFIIRLTYLTGRVYSAVFDDGDVKAVPEWPPHPSRLFSALVSAWGESGADPSLRTALEWLEQQPPPSIHAGGCSVRKLVQAYVPVNDEKTLPEDRSRKGRTFPSATLDHPQVLFVWPDSPPAHVIPALREILSRTSSLGHSASLVEAEIVDTVETADREVWQPGAGSGTRMRIPYRGRLGELVTSYARFEKSPDKVFRPSAGETTLYERAKAAAGRPVEGVFGSMIVLRRDFGPPASLRSALSLTAALRGAMMKHSPQPPPEFLSGHSPASTENAPVRSERPHVALIPLANVGARHSDGSVLGVAALMPRSFSREEQRLCWQIFGEVQQLDMPWGAWGVSLADAEERRRTLRPERWSGTSKLWSTVTPFVFDRYPKDPFGPEAEQIVREAFVRVGFPAPAELDLHYNPWHIGGFKASAYPPAPARPGKPRRYHCHVRAVFSDSIRGPVVAGAGRYYGYGLFLPLPAAGGGR